MNFFPKEPEKVLIKIAYVAAIVGIIYFVLPKALTFASPFIFAYIISKLILPISEFLSDRFRFPKRLSIIVVMLLLIGILGFLAFTLFYQAAYELQNFAYIVPSLLDGDVPLPEWFSNIENFYIALPDAMQEFITMVTENLRENIYSILQPATKAVINAATKAAKALPNVIIFTVIMLLATYFICSDRENIRAFFKKTLPERTMRRITYVKNDLIKACGGYMKAQGILMCVTFFVLLIGLTILGVEASTLIAFIIAVVDVIPVLGTGTVILPWAAISLISGKYFFAVGLGIIYVVSFLIRRFAEPKIVSQQLGLHPLITLLAVYVGLRSAGVVGMILGPVIAIIIINFFNADERYREEIKKTE